MLCFSWLPFLPHTLLGLNFDYPGIDGNGSGRCATFHSVFLLILFIYLFLMSAIRKSEILASEPHLCWNWSSGTVKKRSLEAKGKNMENDLSLSLSLFSTWEPPETGVVVVSEVFVPVCPWTHKTLKTSFPLGHLCSVLPSSA